MAEDFVTCTVTRTEFGLSPLEIVPSNGYYIARNGIGPGGITHAKTEASSPFVDGSFLVHRRKEMSIIPMVVNVRASTAIALHGRIEELTEAFTQFSFKMNVEIDGVAYEWSCETANFTVGDNGAWGDLELRSYHQRVALEVPRMPTIRR